MSFQITPPRGSSKNSIVGSDRWNQILFIMIDNHHLTQPTWQYIMDHGGDELERRLRESYRKFLLQSFDQLLSNNKLGSMAADRREIIAQMLLDQLDFRAAEIQKEYDTKDKEFPKDLEKIIFYLNQIEGAIQYLLDDKSVSYNANLMKRNNQLTVTDKMKVIIERLSEDLHKGNEGVSEVRERLHTSLKELAGMKSRIHTLELALEQKQEELKEKQLEVEETQIKLDEKQIEAEKNQKQLEEKQLEAEEIGKELNKRDAQFEEMKSFMTLQTDFMKNLAEENKDNKTLMTKLTEDNQDNKSLMIKLAEENKILNKNVEDLKSNVTSHMSSLENNVNNAIDQLPKTTSKAIVTDVKKEFQAQNEALQKQADNIKELNNKIQGLNLDKIPKEETD